MLYCKILFDFRSDKKGLSTRVNSSQFVSGNFQLTVLEILLIEIVCPIFVLIKVVYHGRPKG